MKNLFENLENLALQIFTEDRAADYFGNSGIRGTGKGLSALAALRAKKSFSDEKPDMAGPSVLERASKHLSGEAKEKAIEHTKKMEVAKATPNSNKEKNYTPTADANNLSAGSKSPTKLAVLSYQRWAFSGFNLQDADDFIEEFQKEFGDFKYNKISFFYKLGTGDTWRGVATFKNIDRSKIKKVVKDIGNQNKIDSKDSRLQFIMQEGGKRIVTGTGANDKVEDKKEIRKHNKTFIFGRHDIHYVIPLPIFGGYKKYARFIKFIKPIKVASGITVSEIFLMDASEFSGNTDTTYTRGLYYFDGFDRFVTIADNLAKYMFMTTMPSGFRRMKNNLDFGLAYQSAIFQIEEILRIEYKQTNYQPNFTDINNVILKLAKESVGVWTPELLVKKLPSIYVQKILNNIPLSTEEEIDNQHKRLTSFDKESEDNDVNESPDIGKKNNNELEISEEDL